MWIPNIELEKREDPESCYYYSNDCMTEGVEIVEHSKNRFTISYLENETWSFMVNNQMLIRTFIDVGGEESSIIFEETLENVDALQMCEL